MPKSQREFRLPTSSTAFLIPGFLHNKGGWKGSKLQEMPYAKLHGGVEAGGLLDRIDDRIH